jgi:hypothetical protein
VEVKASSVLQTLTCATCGQAVTFDPTRETIADFFARHALAHIEPRQSALCDGCHGFLEVKRLKQEVPVHLRRRNGPSSLTLMVCEHCSRGPRLERAIKAISGGGQ